MSPFLHFNLIYIFSNHVPNCRLPCSLKIYSYISLIRFTAFADKFVNLAGLTYYLP